MNNIKKIIHFNFMKQIPLKMNRPKKSKLENFCKKAAQSR